LNEEGVAAMILDTGAVSRGSGGDSSNKEKTVRAAMIEADLVEAVILLPENLFYNTTAAGLVLVLRKDKPADRRGQILLINASAHFVKEKPKNVFTAEGQRAVVEVYQNWESREKFSQVIDLERARKEDHNLSPSAFIQVGEKQIHRDIGDIIVDLRDARIAREEADANLSRLLTPLLGLGVVGDA
jgi:type I restriction enzyme M protein